jgi:hypothetical protein
MKFTPPSLSLSFLALALTHPSTAITVLLGHDQISNYAWTDTTILCPGVTISPVTSSLCDKPFTLGSSTYKLSQCGDDANFQLQERAGEDGWVFNSYCYPPDSGDLSIKCGESTEQWVVVETFRCGVPERV